MHDYSKLISYLSQYNVTVSDEQIKQLDTYYEMMIETNKSLNLTAITEFDDVLIKHYIDSVTIVRDVDLTVEKSVIDVGTGAGFPGMVLKIIFPELNITLFDSLQKRLTFLNEVIDALNLKDIRAIHDRAEDAARKPDMRARYDFVVSRAVAALPVLSEYTLPFVKDGGYLVSYKTPEAEKEIGEAANAIRILGGGKPEVYDLALPDSDITRSFIVIKKIKSTPKAYPRKAGTAKKNPL